MRRYDVVIVGGGIAGTTVAETFRAGDAASSVLLISDEPHPLYSRILLPQAILGKVDDQKIFLKPPDFYSSRRIETVFGRAVTVVSPKRRTLALDGGEEISWGKLVIAAGSRPRDLGVPGDHLPGVLRLQTYADALEIRRRLQTGTEMAIVGSGRIALEFAAIASEKKIRCVMLNRGPHFWASVVGPGIGAAVGRILEGLGVALKNGVKVTRIEGQHQAAGVDLATGERIPCTAVGVGIGVEVPTEPFAALGLGHGIMANQYLETGHPGVWAAGDCAEFEDTVLGGLRHVGSGWTNALAQGRHVGRALLEERQPFKLLSPNVINRPAGLNLMTLGEARMRPGVLRVEEVDSSLGHGIEWHLLDGRVIGAVLLNAPGRRAEALEKITLSTSRMSGGCVK